MMKWIRFYGVFFLVFWFANSYGQSAQVKITTYYPKDSSRFETETDFSYHNAIGYERARYGKTTMIIQAESAMGNFYFVFKKKIKSTDHQEAHTQEVYGTLPDGTFGVVRQDEVPGYTLTDHDLYAFILVEDHGGLVEKARFQDFGNAVYWPQFDYKNCLIEAVDGFPVFYLSYLGDSDGLDAKPYKQLVYYFSKEDRRCIKAKATAYYPSGNEEDVYHVVYDQTWQAMPAAYQARSKAILVALEPDL